jgi:diacylglycerol kinase family enzyme
MTARGSRSAAQKRLAAALALALVALAVVLGVVRLADGFAGGVLVLVCAIVAVGGAAYGLVRRGPARAAGLAVAAAGLAGAVIAIVDDGHAGVSIGVLVALGLALAAARAAFTVHVALPFPPAPERPVLFFNPKSGGGKAERFHVAGEAAKRGIEAIELRRDDDLESLVRGAVERGADALSMAGGDGSQAVVAKVAAELGLPYACIPAGTRNHLALDLGVDRDDVVGALDAFVDGGERVVDLAEVNGQVFVNNVSLGFYASAVQRKEYRDAKLRTMLDMVPEVLGPEAEGLDLHWARPGRDERSSAVAILVSNNVYRLGRVIASGTRPRLDAGVLGVAVIGGSERNSLMGLAQRPLDQWSARDFEVNAAGPVPAGIDGEALVLDPPLRFTIRPAALRVRIARAHPGASPAAGAPDGPVDAVRSLAAIAAGRDPTASGGARA